MFLLRWSEKSAQMGKKELLVFLECTFLLANLENLNNL
jgi:hypothetical protein